MPLYAMPSKNTRRYSKFSLRVINSLSKQTNADATKLTNASSKLKEEVFVEVSASEDHDVCALEDSPYHIFRVSGQGQVDVVAKLLEEDESKATAKDTKGWTCLHHAASKGRLKVIDILLDHHAEIDAVNDEGCTPLHLACVKGKLDSIKHLIMAGARTDIMSEKFMAPAPIHLATFHNLPKVIEALMEFPERVDIDIPGQHGATALHVAAIMNHPECARTLLDHGAKLCQPCDNGFYPLHVAAKNGSKDCLEIILQEGGKRGYSRDTMLSYVDQEKNSPLHSAVNGGDIRTVQICIEHGARIDSRQDDQATAFHLACSQGTLPIVRIMLEAHLNANPENGLEILFSRDILDMTPLHRAAMFDHPEVVDYLIEKGAEVDCLDSERRTPLLLAAVRGCTTVFKRLLEKRARLGVKDVNKRSVLHYIASLRGNMLEQFNMICSTDEGIKLINHQDEMGCTALHLASKEGNLHYLDRLITLGATLNLKDNDEQSPLHFAARYGRVNTVRRLLNSCYGAIIINETDGVGMTAMHISSLNGHTKVVQILVQKGALLHKDYMGNTPLHYAAERGYSQTLKLLLSYHMNLLNQVDKKGNSALYKACATNQPSACEMLLTSDCLYVENSEGYYPLDIATENRNVEVLLAVIKHRRWKEILDMPSKSFICPLLGLIQIVPEVYLALLNRCHTKATHTDSASRDYWEKFDFQFMQTDARKLRAMKKDSKNEKRNSVMKPLLAMNTMVKFGRVELLSHPVSTAYLDMKWKAYGAWVFMFNLLLYLLFLGCLTGMIASLDPGMNVTKAVPIYLGNTNATASPISHMMGPGYQLAGIFVFVFLVLNILKEIIQIWQQRWAYVGDPINLIEWMLYLSALIFVVPALVSHEISMLQWRCAAVTIFLAWFNLLLYLRRLDSVGIFVVMFLQILHTVLRVMLIFSVLFVAFGLTFYILLINDRRGGFQNPIMSTVHSVMMMMGDWDFVGTFVNPEANNGLLLHPFLSFMFLVLFVILMPILFINLLIGLAVGDIEMVQNHAQLQRLAMQVEYHTELEEKLPGWLLFRVDKKEFIVSPNKRYGGSSIGRMLDSCMSTMNSAMSGQMKGNNRPTEFLSPSHDNLAQEMAIVKRKMKETQTNLDKQYDLLKLIVEKMEIVAEASHYDEGVINDVSVRYDDSESLTTPIQSPTSPQLSKTATNLMFLNKWKK